MACYSEGDFTNPGPRPETTPPNPTLMTTVPQTKLCKRRHPVLAYPVATCVHAACWPSLASLVPLTRCPLPLTPASSPQPLDHQPSAASAESPRPPVGRSRGDSRAAQRNRVRGQEAGKESGIRSGFAPFLRSITRSVFRTKIYIVVESPWLLAAMPSRVAF